MKLKYALMGALLSTAFILNTSVKAQTIVVDNGTFNNTRGYDISDFANADDFTIASPVTFNTIRFWAADTSLVGANFTTLDAFNGTLSWVVYSDLGQGYPTNTIIAQGAVSSGISIGLTGLLIGANPIFELNVPIVPTTIASAGTYWLRLQEGNLGDIYDNSSIYWMESSHLVNVGAGSPGTINGRTPSGAYVPITNPGGWGFNDRDSGFQLVSAPEPGTLALLFCAAGGLLARKSRKRTA
jgi:hypothetical protein